MKRIIGVIRHPLGVFVPVGLMIWGTALLIAGWILAGFDSDLHRAPDLLGRLATAAAMSLFLVWFNAQFDRLKGGRDESIGFVKPRKSKFKSKRQTQALGFGKPSDYEGDRDD